MIIYNNKIKQNIVRLIKLCYSNLLCKQPTTAFSGMKNYININFQGTEHISNKNGFKEKHLNV